MASVQWFDDLDDLWLAIDIGMIDVLQSVIPVAEDILRRHIKSDVYISGEPHAGRWVNGTTYTRRYDIADGVTTEWDSDHSITVTSTAIPSQSIVKGSNFASQYAGAFLQLLESGHMGILKSGAAHGFPRPVVTNAQRDVENSSKITSAIEKGLKKSGMK